MASIVDDPSKIPEILSQLRNSWSQGITRPVEYRIKQLKSFKQGVLDTMAEVGVAAQQDIGRSPFQTKIFDSDLFIQIIDHLVKNLKSWVYEKVDTPMMTGPGSSYIIHEPLGVALVMGTWNFPTFTSLNPAAEAIAAGNCVLLKPSEMAPAQSKVICKIFEQYLDPLCYRVIEGGPAVAEALLTFRYDLICYTGSTEKGKLVAAAAAKYMTPTILELGGKSPTIVDSDANLRNAALRITQGKWSNAGQICIAPDYVLVMPTVREQLIEEIKTVLVQFYGNDPKNHEDYAKIINEPHTKRLESLLNSEHGGQVIYGGQVDVGSRFIAPTLIFNPNEGSNLMENEIFGPILPIIEIASIGAAIDFINAREKPLALYYFGSNSKTKEEILHSTSSGGVCVNECLFHVTNIDLPFGGVGFSGHSMTHGKYAFHAMTHAKSVLDKGCVNSWPFNVRYPPYTQGNQKLFAFLAKSMNFTQGDAQKAVLAVILLILAYYIFTYF